ncbi:MAG: radical SAM protein [Promethearchaeota archaeon]|nr:MAG: radical SAM protein [Candidatus Lokiarchaeota archaeon]
MNNSRKEPIRYVKRDSNGKLIPPFPFDPWELTKQTRKLVCRKTKGIVQRKYTHFYKAGVYGGIATAYSVGCNFRCIFCWADWSRDWPELYGHFYSPDEIYSKLRDIMSRKGVKRARISGAEPTLCPDHLCAVLERVNEDSEKFDLFIIETNGVVLANDENLAPRLSKYASRDRRKGTVGYVRLSIRGGLPEKFEEKTGCKKEFVDLPFKAAERLWNAGVSFHVAVVVDPRFTPMKDKEIIYNKLKKIDPLVRRQVEEEYLSPYAHALVRLRAVGRDDVTGKKMTLKERAALKERPSY